MRKRVIVCIVTYNRTLELIKCIDTIKKQSFMPDKIVIINNGELNVQSFIAEYMDNIDYAVFNSNENIGCSGGVDYAIKATKKDKFDYLLFFDDDAFCYNTKTIENLIIKANEMKPQNSCLIINSLVVSQTNNEELSFGFPGIKTVFDARNEAKGGIIIDHINPFNGTLITPELINIVGSPNPKYFSKGDESEYQCRAMSKGALVATAVDSIVCHPSPRKLLNKKFFVLECTPEQDYYKIRNYLDIFYLYFKNDIREYFEDGVQMIKEYQGTPLYQKRICYFNAGVRDFVSRQFGKKDFSKIKITNERIVDFSIINSFLKNEAKIN